MQWRGRRESDNVEDRRSLRPRHAAIGGGGLLIIVVAYTLLGGNPLALLSSLQQANVTQGPAVTSPAASAAEEEAKRFVSVVLADTEDVWSTLFAAAGRTYVEPKLVLFRGRVNSACGLASAAVGPFYCPEDQNVYIDLAFFEELRRRFHAPGDFAQAYVLAHEIGHHVQKLLGTSDKVDSARRWMSGSRTNDLSVRLELQADFYAGVWAHHAQKMKKILDPGDLEEALNAASQIGDDKIQMEGQGYVVPDSFTHGTAAQRLKWFKLGFETGDMRKGDTFNARQL